MYVLFEGVDGCGKSTQIDKIAQKHPKAVLTREPGGTDFGKKAREILLENSLHSQRAEMLLFLADRAEHYETVVKPNRDKHLVISDRGFLSGMAYALASGGVDPATLFSLNRFALQDNLPEYIILFVISPDTLAKRLAGKELDGIESRGIDYLMRVQGFLVESADMCGIPVLTIDADENREIIHQRILNYLKI